MLKFGNTFVNVGGTYLTGIVNEHYDDTEVQIGSQIWMKRNLTYDDGKGGIRHTTPFDLTEWGEQYYYTWDAANRVANKIEGWRLPTIEDWNTLINYVGTNPAYKLKSTSGWFNNQNGSDEYGFCVLPTEYYKSTIYGGFHAYFWSSTPGEWPSEGTYWSYVFDRDDRVYGAYHADPNNLYTIRLIKDI